MFAKKHSDVLLFCRNHNRIILYGAGVYGKVLCCYLLENNIDIEAFAVTNPVYNRVLNHKVVSINELDLFDDIGVIVCGNDHIIPEMTKVLEDLMFGDYLCVNREIIETIDSINSYDQVYHETGEKHILLYHRVTDLFPDVWNIAVSPETFRRHLLFLKSNYKVVPFEQIYDYEDECVAITFDDGYADFYQKALPIINDLEVPVTVFVATGRIGTGKAFWWDEIEDVVWNTKDCPVSIQLEGEKIDLQSEAAKLRAIENIRQIFFKYDFESVDYHLDELAKLLNAKRRSNPVYRCMTGDELREIDKSPWVSIGAHTVTHTRLTSESKEQQKWELEESKVTLERMLGHEITSFSFPFGCEPDYDEVSIQAALDAGYKRIIAVRTKFYEEEKYKYNLSRITIGGEKNSLSKSLDDRDIRRNLYLGTWMI